MSRDPQLQIIKEILISVETRNPMTTFSSRLCGLPVCTLTNHHCALFPTRKYFCCYLFEREQRLNNICYATKFLTEM